MSVQTALPAGEEEAVEASPRVSGREGGVTLIAIYHFVLGGLCLVSTVLIALAALITGIVGIFEDPEVFMATVILLITGGVTLALSILLLVVGYGVWKERQWGRSAAIALALLSLFFFPLGTVAGVIILWYLIKPDVSASFAG